MTMSSSGRLTRSRARTTGAHDGDTLATRDAILLGVALTVLNAVLATAQWLERFSELSSASRRRGAASQHRDQ